ncbi:Rha family transcriptional regulator [Bacillus sp. UNCCL81]|uniref:Rha family transcriptional regulator n=1 Tax=Bacillus sp. UNCCL81 TaxID=1502755 RepID=UPI0008E23DC7|nr:Rha family transcriptional regulator [Bacillus sp. UNCCL81]SFD44792.1 phage regulatory protein, rha family [Bacillus sp. UNCCL81]
MSTLQVVNHNGVNVISSVEVSEMVGRDHSDLMKSIRKYAETLHSANLPSENFFLSSEYLNSRKQKQPCFLLTKKGCDMVANKMTGEKGILFTAAYVDKFHEMEKVVTQLLPPMTPLRMIHTMTNEMMKQDERLVSLEEKVNNQLTLDFGQQRMVQNAKNKRVYQLWNNGTINKDILDTVPKVHAAIGRDLKNAFAVNSFRDIRKHEYEEAINYINAWRASLV